MDAGAGGVTVLTLDELTEGMVEKVHDLLTAKPLRLYPVAGWEDRAIVVAGNTGVYTVRAYDDGVKCECIAASTGDDCSHVLAAMVAWAEMLDTPFGSSQAAGDAPW